MAADTHGKGRGKSYPAFFNLPITKARVSLENLQDSDCFFYRARRRPVGRIRCNTEESRFCEWAKTNVIFTGRDEPILRCLVMLVAGVHQRDQDVQIK